jgi:hypothetical protein
MKRVLKRECAYVSPRSNLAILILFVYFSNDDYTDVKGTIFNTDNGQIYEMCGRYTLYHDLIQDWVLMPASVLSQFELP